MFEVLAAGFFAAEEVFLRAEVRPAVPVFFEADVFEPAAVFAMLFVTLFSMVCSLSEIGKNFLMARDAGSAADLRAFEGSGDRRILDRAADISVLDVAGEEGTVEHISRTGGVNRLDGICGEYLDLSVNPGKTSAGALGGDDGAKWFRMPATRSRSTG